MKNLISLALIGISVSLLLVGIVAYHANGQTTNSSHSLPIQYANYTSDKYQIKFQYPSDWILKEKTNRFEEGSDITISDDDIGKGDIGITHIDDLLATYGSPDLRTAVIDLHKGIVSGFEYDYRTIEPPSFLEIDGQRAGTFLITFKQMYETNPIMGASQWWITYLGNHGYTFNFISSPNTFDSAHYTEIRDHFIKSIKFLGVNNQTISNGTNRFG